MLGRSVNLTVLFLGRLRPFFFLFHSSTPKGFFCTWAFSLVKILVLVIFIEIKFDFTLNRIPSICLISGNRFGTKKDMQSKSC